MSFSRLVILLAALTLCLAPLGRGGRTQAHRTGSVLPAASAQWNIAAPGPLAAPCRITTGSTTLVSVSLDKNGGKEPSIRATISADGRFIAFSSYAGNLVPGDTNGLMDIFVRDRQQGKTERISLASDGSQGNGDSDFPSISADGRFVAFSSNADNLVEGDTNGSGDVFVHDRLSGETQRVSLGSDEIQGNDYSYDPSISADGRFVAFISQASNLLSGDSNGVGDIFIRDRQAGETMLISIASDQAQANAESASPSISADGHFVAFSSRASNLTTGDTNSVSDVFVHDRLSGETQRVSLASNGIQGDNKSYAPSISADGHLVVFTSRASNLVGGDTNGADDIFVHDSQSGETLRVSLASDGTQGNDDSYGSSISADGRFVTFDSEASNLVDGDTNGKMDVFVHDFSSGKTFRASVSSGGLQASDDSFNPVTSSDGRYVTFASNALDLVTLDATGVRNIFVHDQGPQGQNVEARFSAEKASGVAPLEVTFANLSVGNFTDNAWDFGDGTASALFSPTHLYTTPGAYTVTLTASGPGGTDTLICPGYVTVYDRLGSLTLASLASDGTQANSDSRYSSISADGHFVAFCTYADNLVQGDTNVLMDVFVHNRLSGETRRVSVASDGTQGNGYSWDPSISADGRYVAFSSEANNLVTGDTNEVEDVFVHDLQSGETRRISVSSTGTQGNNTSNFPSISADGRWVVFSSSATNLVERDTNGIEDIFVHDLQSGETRRVSVAPDGTQGNGYSYSPSISADGHFVAFASDSDNLVKGDTNKQYDVFVHDRLSGKTQRVSIASDGTQGNGYPDALSISADGRWVAFYSQSDNLVEGDTNGIGDIFVHDCQSKETQRVSVSSSGMQANGLSYAPSISSDGRFVAFRSAASNLVTWDTNDSQDIFVYDRQNRETRRVSIASDGTQALRGVDEYDWPAISAGGRSVTFVSGSDNLVSGDTNNTDDVFVSEWELQGAAVQANFSAAPLSGVGTLTVTFTNQTTCGRDVACNVSTSLWFFGDWSTSTLSSPTHTYTAPGIYTVMLFASGPGGTDTLTRPGYIVVRSPLSHYLPLVRH